MFKHRQLLKWDITLLLLLFFALLTTILLIQQLRQIIVPRTITATTIQPSPTSIPQHTPRPVDPPASAPGAGTVETTSESAIPTLQFFSPTEIERHQSLEVSQRLISDLSSVPVEQYSGSAQDIPKDIIEQLFYGTPGGGGFFCLSAYELPRIDVIIGGDPAILGQEFIVFHTGWAASGETLMSRLTLPSEEVIEGIHPTEPSNPLVGCEYYSYTTKWIDPLGLYELSLTGNNETISTSVTVAPPTEPSLFETDNGILLFGFSPNEQIRIFIYDFDKQQIIPGDLKGWDNFVVGKDGTLAILISNELISEKHGYFVLGDTSGWFRGGSNVFIPPISGNDIYNVVTALPYIQTLEIREAPGSEIETAKLPPESQLVVIGASYFDSTTNTRWLPVRAETGLSGWVDESKVQVVRITTYNELYP